MKQHSFSDEVLAIILFVGAGLALIGALSLVLR
jgi:hypothetical protein